MISPASVRGRPARQRWDSLYHKAWAQRFLSNNGPESEAHYGSGYPEAEAEMLNKMAQGGTFDSGPVVYYALPSGSWVSYLPRMSFLTTISWSWTSGRHTGGELA